MIKNLNYAFRNIVIIIIVIIVILLLIYCYYIYYYIIWLFKIWYINLIKSQIKSEKINCIIETKNLLPPKKFVNSTLILIVMINNNNEYSNNFNIILKFSGNMVLKNRKKRVVLFEWTLFILFAYLLISS